MFHMVGHNYPPTQFEANEYEVSNSGQAPHLVRVAPLHSWHVDNFWASVQTRPLFSRSGDAVGDVGFSDATLVLDKLGHVHTMPVLGSSDVAIWVGKDIQRRTHGRQQIVAVTAALPKAMRPS